MPFWSDPQLPEPLRQNRWYIQFGNLSGYQYALKSCSKPEYDIGVSEHVLLNHTFRYPKNLVWKPITVKMVAVRNQNINKPKGYENTPYPAEQVDLTHKLMILLRDSGYAIDNTPYFSMFNKNPVYQSISKSNLSKQLGGNIKLTQIDANGNPVENFELTNPFISNVKFGNLSYDNDGFVDIDLTIQYDYAIYNPDISAPNEEGVKRNNFIIFGLDTGINNFLEPRQEKTFTPGFPGQRRR